MRLKSEEFYYYIFIACYLLSIVNMKNPLAFGSGTLSVFIYAFVLVFLFGFILNAINNGLFYISIVKRGWYLLILLMPSVFFSDFFSVSFLKFVPFFTGILMLSFLSSKLALMSVDIKEKLLFSVVKVNRVVIALSAFLFGLGMGFPRNETGFAGFFNHPQSFGVYLLFFLLFELTIIQLVRVKYYSYFFISVILVMSYMTESRLSLGSNFILLFMYLYYLGKVSVVKKTFVTIAILFFFSFMYKSIFDVGSHVISKRGRAENQGIEALSDSRMKFVEASYNNFLDSPVVGIGFQISNGKYGHFIMDLSPSDFFGLPLNASVEKGVFWSALLEESGILGFVAFLYFLLVSLWVGKGKFSRLFFIGIILIGMGESFFFSIGGVGFFVWVSLFLIIAVEETRKC